MKSYRNRFWSALIVAFALLAVGCAKLHATSSQASSQANTAAGAAQAAQTPSSNPDDLVPRVKVQDAMKEVADGKAVIVDVRGTDAYKMAHVKGALDIGLAKFEAKDFKDVPKDKRVIAYCT